MKRLVVIGLLAACSSDPVNVAGNYTVGVTSRDNGCNLGGWTVGQMTSGISVQITQTGGDATANVTGFGAAFGLDVLLGSHAFTGTVDGNSLDLKIMGTNAQQSGNCTFTYTGEIVATSNGDSLAGRINYTPATNGNSDCAAITGCVSFQEFNGSRPPQ